MPAEVVDDLLAKLKSEGDPIRLLRLHKHEYNQELWTRSPQLYRAFAKSLISTSNYGRSAGLSREGMHWHRSDADLRYLSGLALARMGDLKRAESEVSVLTFSGDARLRYEAVALHGRLYKDRFLRAQDEVRRRRFAEHSARRYKEAWDLHVQLSSGPKAALDPFAAINAATMYVLAGESTAARAIAAEVLGMSPDLLENVRDGGDLETSEDRAWRYATLGEAAIISGNEELAAGCYQRAIKFFRTQTGNLATMRRNVRLLAMRLGIDHALLELFGLGSVVVFSGEPIDSPLEPQAKPRFPDAPQVEAQVRSAIATELTRLNTTVGYCCPRAGAEIIFAEELLLREAQVHLVFPCAKADFYATAVDFAILGFDRWQQRLDALLKEKNVTAHYASRQRYRNESATFSFLASFMLGLAANHAIDWGIPLHGLALIDESESPRENASSLVLRPIEVADRRPVEWTCLRLNELRSGATFPPLRQWPRPQAAPSKPDIAREVKAMLFADVKNFSSLRDEESPLFFEKFAEIVGSLTDGKWKPVFCNTWGDGLFAVFDTAPDAAEFALDLLERVQEVDWENWGLPDDTTVRIGLHAGPVYRRYDAILHKENFFGENVTRAARIEPVTLPGCAFASEQFAALIAASARTHLMCIPVGKEQLAKNYDDACPLFRLDRAQLV